MLTLNGHPLRCRSCSGLFNVDRSGAYPAPTRDPSGLSFYLAEPVPYRPVEIELELGRLIQLVRPTVIGPGGSTGFGGETDEKDTVSVRSLSSRSGRLWLPPGFPQISVAPAVSYEINTASSQG